jgi:hypothetical protein
MLKVYRLIIVCLSNMSNDKEGATMQEIWDAIGMDHQYSVVEYLVLWFRLRIGNQAFIEKDMNLTI